MASLTSLSSENNPEVLVQENNPFATTLVLNRPRQRNSLSPGMLSRISNLFLALEDDPKLKLVILKAYGKAFCSGGDILEIARQLDNDNWRVAIKTNTETYKLLHSIATCRKPQVSILDRVCIGRGVAIAISCGFRIATENSMFQVPEWEPCRLELVSDKMVDRYFTKLDADDELRLHAKSSIHMPSIYSQALDN